MRRTVRAAPGTVFPFAFRRRGTAASLLGKNRPVATDSVPASLIDRLPAQHHADLRRPEATAGEVHRLREALEKDEPEPVISEEALRRITESVPPVPPLGLVFERLFRFVLDRISDRRMRQSRSPGQSEPSAENSPSRRRPTSRSSESGVTPLPVTVYLSDEAAYHEVQAAVENLPTTAGLTVLDREEPTHRLLVPPDARHRLAQARRRCPGSTSALRTRLSATSRRPTTNFGKRTIDARRSGLCLLPRPARRGVFARETPGHQRAAARLMSVSECRAIFRQSYAGWQCPCINRIRQQGS